MTLTTGNRVSAAYAADGKGPMVYGKYKDHGFAVNPLMHRVGVATPENASASEAFAIAGLNWTAEKRPVYFLGQDGPLEAPQSVAIVRSDNDDLLGIHSSTYTPVQHSELINLLDYLREDIQIENVLSIRQGKKIYVTASIHTEGDVLPGDKVRRYLHAFNSFDGSSAFGVFFSDIRLRCANQLNYLTRRGFTKAVDAGQGLRMRHTASVTEFARNLPRFIDLERREFNTSMDQLRALTRVDLTEARIRQVLEATFSDKLARPVRDKGSTASRPRLLSDLTEIDTIRGHLEGNTGYGITDVPGAAGTAYGLFNAITQFTTHDTGRAKDETERARARLESLFGGESAKRIQRAREACLALV